MSFRDCIPDMLSRGEIDEGRAAEMRAMFDELEAHYRREFGAAAASAMAGEETVARLEALAARRKRLALLQVQAQRRALDDMRGYGGGGDGPVDPRAATALFDHDPRAPYANVEAQRRAIKGRAHAMIDGILAKHRRTLAGNVRSRAELDDLVREAFGERTGNEGARQLAQAWAEAAEMLRRRFNAAGGNIGKLARWGLPQSHDARNVREAGWSEWRAEILPRLDRARMIDERTGRPFTDEGLEAALREVFETIRTDGWSKAQPGAPGTRALANRRGESRFLHFKSADDWLAYQARFGQGTAFDAMMGQIEGMATDIARMEILGPNPEATVRWLQDTIQREAALEGDDMGRAGDRAFAATRRIQRLDDEITGRLRRPENRKLALVFSSIRSLQTAAKLGSATLSAVSDTGFQAWTRRFNGLRGARMIGDVTKLLAPGAEADRRLAVRLGLIAEEWSRMASAQHRYLNEELTGEVSRRLAEGVLRASGLSHWTQSNRWAFGMEFLGFMTDQSVKGFDALDPAFRGALQRYGIGEAEWDRIRATPLEMERGVPWIKPQNIEDEALGDAVLRMVLTETDFAVPVADLRTRAMMHSIAPKGTLIGETALSALLFKSFGISVVLRHGGRIMALSGANRLRYAAGLFVGVTLGGALALQLKEIAKGRDPRPMTDERFWGAAILQGGGFGIFGDFLGAAQNRFGGGFAQTLAGPLPDTAQSLAGLAIAAFDEDENAAGEALRLAQRELPGSSLWYARLAFERTVLDRIEEETDPDFRRNWRAAERRAAETGQQFWWAPGDAEPERAPDLENALGEMPE